MTRNKNLDIVVEETIDFLESLHGTKKMIKFKRKENCYSCKGSGASLGTKAKTCWTCSGKGAIQFRNGPEIKEEICKKCNGKGVEIKSKCGACKGEGNIVQLKQEEVEIPGYVKEGAELVIKDKGNFCEKSHRKGNLIIKVKVQESKIFHRKGPHIFTAIELSFAEGMVGSKTNIETIWGQRKVTFKGLTKPEHLMTLPRHGVFNYEKKVYGNHYVRARLVPPKILTPEMEALYKELGNLGM